MYIKRLLEDEILKWIDEREVIGIIGPRQSGKTTLLLHLKEILSTKYAPNHIVFLNFEDELERTRFQQDPKGYVKSHMTSDGKYLFLIDEVQYVEKAGQKLKLLFDENHEQIKFVISGSSSLDLRDVGGSLVGRIVMFELYPFSFEEFMLAKDARLHKYYKNNRFDISKGVLPSDAMLLPELNRLLAEYMTYGGFPRVVLMEDVSKKETLLSSLITTYIEKDILKIYGTPFRNDAMNVAKALAFDLGGMVNFEGLSSTLKMDLRKLMEVVSILESTYVIRQVRPYFKSLPTELRKRPKVYFIDLGLRNILVNDLSFAPEKGQMLENHVFTQLLRSGRVLNYWRTTSKAEVDFVSDGIPIEVKATVHMTRALSSFIHTYSPKFGVLANLDTLEENTVEKTKVLSVPLGLL